jgi:hypothetical protein
VFRCLRSGLCWALWFFAGYTLGTLARSGSLLATLLDPEEKMHAKCILFETDQATYVCNFVVFEKTPKHVDNISPIETQQHILECGGVTHESKIPICSTFVEIR